MITTRRYFGRTAERNTQAYPVAAGEHPARTVRTDKKPDGDLSVSLSRAFWTTAPAAGFTALCASQILRMSFSQQATHVTGMTIAGGSAKPAKSEVTPIGGYTT